MFNASSPFVKLLRAWGRAGRIIRYGAHHEHPTRLHFTGWRDVRRARDHCKVLFIIAVVVIAHGGWQVRSGNANMGKMSIVGGLLLGLAVLIAEALFNAGGLPTIQISR